MDNFVFDFDGTVAKNRTISPENVKALKKITNLYLNTSRSYDELPQIAKEVFKKIMCLNGSLYYVNNKLIKKFKALTKEEVALLVDHAVENNYNLAFNNNSMFYNVVDPKSKAFMNDRNIKHTSEITIPDEVFQLAITSYREIKIPNTDVNYFKQAPHFIEFCKNSKANIKGIVGDFIAFGDNNNDIPMFKVAKKFYKIGKDIKYSDTWIKELYE